MSRGFITVARGVFDHPMFAPEPYTEREAWLWMIEQAAWRDTKVRVGRTWIELKRGQLAFATRFLATKWQWSESRVRRRLVRHQSDAMIVVQPTRDATLITICNYDKYQGTRRADDAQTDAPPVTNLTRSRRKEEGTNKLTTNSSLRSEARKRATRIPDNWKPSLEDREFAKAQGLTDTEVDRQSARFLDFWIGKSGQGATKADWPATWRNWTRTEAEKLGRAPTGAAVVVNEVFVALDSPKWGQLSSKWRDRAGKNTGPPSRDYPVGTGWYFPSEWVA